MHVFRINSVATKHRDQPQACVDNISNVYQSAKEMHEENEYRIDTIDKPDKNVIFFDNTTTYRFITCGVFIISTPRFFSSSRS